MSTHVDMLAVILLLWTLIIVGTEGQKSIQLRYLIVSESTERELPSWVSEYTASEVGAKVSDTIIMLDRQREDEAYSQLCDALSSGVTIVLDLTWYPWSRMDKVMEDKGVTVIRSQLGDQGLIQAYNQYLELRNATDLAIVFENEDDLDRGLCELMRTSGVRLWAEWSGRRDVIAAIKSMRPVPEHYAAVGSRDYVTRIYKQAIEEKMTRMPYRWTLLVTDYMTVARGDVTGAVYTLSADRKECCALQNQTAACNCPDNIKDLESYVVVYTCDSVAGDNSTRDTVYRQLADDSDAGNDTLFYWDSNRLSLSLRSRYRFLLNGANDDIENGAKGGGTETVAAWSAGEDIKLSPGVELPTLKRYFRIGTTAAIPWTMHSLDPSTGEHMYNEQGEPVYHGYCIDLIQKISEIMEFDYDMVTPKQGTFGHKLTNGTWDGVIGDLTRGEVDIAIAALTMTAEREEVIDFVAPYFEQTGILIAIRKPVRKTSLFKFMTVLRTEVWLCIIAALVLTGVMIWLLDKYSPYSARNNPEAYPYPCRQFTLKESFWFALTSFTPQGGGEAPKALSSRTLVAAYWLFVVLMLATFTANLAAFLTVERMQAPVSSLEQLARQSRINYTVVEGSTVHQYFINMKHAEDTLYQVWKEITLNATSDQSKYRVWDYPIREQYGHILLAINSSRPVPNATVGFQEVIQHQDADFAFIHDAAEIKYEVTQNCNLTEVGEVFAEQPYAIAVQQGSHLQEEISRALLDLQKDRVLEMLNTRYWNESARNMCPDSDDSEGITLESLGGVFIATLVGLAIAMLTLVWEVFYYKNKEKKTNVDMKQTVTLGGDIFKPVTDNISYINVLPKPNRATNRNNKNIIKDYTA